MTTHDIRCKKDLDIRLISRISGCWMKSKHGCLLRFFKFFTLWPMSSDIWLICRYIEQIFLIFRWNLSGIHWNLVNFVLMSVYYTSDIRLISFISWYPGNTFSTMCYPLTIPFFFCWYFAWLGYTGFRCFSLLIGISDNLWDSVNFHWISETLTDSNLECSNTLLYRE